MHVFAVKMLFLFPMFLLLSSCQIVSSKSPVDIEIADCLTSCWQGLKPGDTEQQVRDFYSVSFDDFDNVFSDGYHFYTANHKEGYSVQSYTADDQLVGIYLYSPSRFALSLEKIIQILGESKYTIVSYGMSVETVDVYPYIVLYYPEAGYAFRVELPLRSRSTNELEVCVEKDALVSEIHVVKQGLIEEVVFDADKATIPSMDSSSVATFINALTEWAGYRCLMLTYPPKRVSP